MFRVVSQFIESPCYLLICDDPRCKATFEHPLPEEVNGNPEHAAVKAAQAKGWIVSIGRQICPGHAEQLRAIERQMQQSDQERSLIVVPRKHVVRTGL